MDAELILASTSIYRNALLKRLNIPFKTIKPAFDEEAHKNMAMKPEQLSLFLAFKKAESVRNTKDCVIGSDQLVELEGQILGKSHEKDKAFMQLSLMQGKTHHLITSTCLIFKSEVIQWSEIVKLKMRSLSAQEIETYLTLDQPYDCAGSYKIESYGISLFEKIEAEDFNSIQGLPLLRLNLQLKKWGF